MTVSIENCRHSSAGEYVKNMLSCLFSSGFLDGADIQNLKDADYSGKHFSLEYPLLAECTPGETPPDATRYFADTIGGKCHVCKEWPRHAKEKFDAWLAEKFPNALDIAAAHYESPSNGILMNIYVGYSWDKHTKSAKGDRFWTPLRDFLLGISRSVEQSFREFNLKISVKRLRSSHGAFLYGDIVSRIQNSDLLVFNVADTGDMFKYPDRIRTDNKAIRFSKFNSNVLFEMGLAMGRGKCPIALCPNSLKNRLPSDIKCYMWSFYDAHAVRKSGKTGIQMKFDDLVGLQNCIRGRIVTRANELIKETLANGVQCRLADKIF